MSNDSELPIHQSFLRSLDSPHLRELLVDAAEATLDSVTDSQILEKLPVFGSMAKMYGGIRTIQHRFFLRKMLRFFGRLGEIPLEDRERFLENMEANPRKAQEVGEAFLIWLDRLDDPFKSELLAKIFELYVRGVIDFDRAARFSAVVDRGHVPYLLTLWDGYLSEEVKSHLLALGLMSVQSKWSEVEQQFRRDVSSRSVDVIKLSLNDDGRVFQDYVIRDVHIPMRLTERIETPPKQKRSRGSR